MAEGEWEVEEVELRLANGTVAAVHRIRFMPVEEETTLLCRWCGRPVFHKTNRANPWRHMDPMHPDGQIICRDDDGRPRVPVFTAEPTVWARGEDEEK